MNKEKHPDQDMGDVLDQKRQERQRRKERKHNEKVKTKADQDRENRKGIRKKLRL